MSTVWKLGIPIPPQAGNKLHRLIFNIAEKEPSLGMDKKLRKKIKPSVSYHVVLGTFNTGFFRSGKRQMRKILKYLYKNLDKTDDLHALFSGSIALQDVGVNGENIADSTLVSAHAGAVYASMIREKVQSLLRQSGIKDKHFQFIEPQAILFRKGKNKKEAKVTNVATSLRTFSTYEIGFGFEQIALYKGNKLYHVFGKSVRDGHPENTFKELLKAELKLRKPVWGFRWTNLCKVYSEVEAAKIRKTYERWKERGLKRKGYDATSILRIVRTR